MLYLYQPKLYYFFIDRLKSSIVFKVRQKSFKNSVNLLLVLIFIQGPLCLKGVTVCEVFACGDCNFDNALCASCLDGYFLTGSTLCDPCLDLGCKKCQQANSYNVCSQCLLGFYYYPPFSCLPCAVGCVDCSDNLNCITCLDNFANFSGVCISCDSIMIGCTSCTATGICLKCNTIGFYFQASNSTCQQCAFSALIPFCALCDFNGLTCSQCAINYVLNGAGTCIMCVNVIQNCISCNNLTTCLTCQTGYYANQSCISCNNITANCQECDQNDCKKCQPFAYSVSGIKLTCPLCSSLLLGCDTCKNSIYCYTCLPGYYIDALVTHKCYLCSAVISNCAACSTVMSTLVCYQCQRYLYFIDKISNQCKLCSYFIPNCLNCENKKTCIDCIGPQFYVSENNNSCLLCSNIFYKCKQCYQRNYCTLCEPGYYLDSNKTCQCLKGKLISGICVSQIGCNSIQLNGTIPVCTGCISDFILTQSSHCVCAQGKRLVNKICTGILGCVSLNIYNPEYCLFCNPSLNFLLDKTSGKCVCKPFYGFQDNKCEEICGDGWNIDLPCDDGNLMNGDGCSSNCSIEPNYRCINNVQKSISSCLYLGIFYIKLINIVRYSLSNSGKFVFEFYPKSLDLRSMNITSAVTLNISNAAFNITSIIYSTGFLEIGFDFTSDLENLLASVNIELNKQLFKHYKFKLDFEIKAKNLRLNYISSIQLFKNLDKVIFILSVIAFGIFIISIFFHKMIGVETVQTFQIIYLLLISIQKYEFPYNLLEQLRWAIGFENFWNYNDEITNYTPNIYQRLHFMKKFGQNAFFYMLPAILFIVLFLIYFIKFIINKKIYYNMQIIKYIKICSTIYKILLFPWIISTSIFLIISGYIHSLRNNYWSTGQIVASKFIFFEEINLILFLMFGIVYGIIIFSQYSVIFNPQKIISSCLSLAKCSQPYISIYLGYNIFIVLIFLLLFNQRSQFILHSAFGIISVYFIYIIIMRPYQKIIHNIGIIINQSTLMIFCIILLHRHSQQNLIPEDTNILLILIIIFLLIIVDLIAVIRLFFEIKSKWMYRSHKLNQIKQKQLVFHEKKLQKSLIQIGNQDFNKYRVQCQIIKQKRDIFDYHNKKRNDLRLSSLDFQLKLEKHQKNAQKSIKIERNNIQNEIERNNQLITPTYERQKINKEYKNKFSLYINKLKSSLE